MDRNSRFEVAVGAEADAYFTYLFDLSQEIRIEKRAVTSLPSIFGDVGGLRDFMSTVAVLVIGGIQSKAF